MSEYLLMARQKIYDKDFENAVSLKSSVTITNITPKRHEEALNLLFCEAPLSLGFVEHTATRMNYPEETKLVKSAFLLVFDGEKVTKILESSANSHNMYNWFFCCVGTSNCAR